MSQGVRLYFAGRQIEHTLHPPGSQIDERQFNLLISDRLMLREQRNLPLPQVLGGAHRDVEPRLRQATEGGADRSGGRFAFVMDSLGLAAILPIRNIEYEWVGDRPERMRLHAALGEQSLHLDVSVDHWLSTEQEAEGRSRTFYQLRGEAEVEGVLVDGVVNTRGTGSFETWSTSGEGPTR